MSREAFQAILDRTFSLPSSRSKEEDGNVSADPLGTVPLPVPNTTRSAPGRELEEMGSRISRSAAPSSFRLSWTGSSVRMAGKGLRGALEAA